MRPITETVPKSLIPVLGRPFAELQLEWLADEGVDRVVYSIGFKGGLIRDALGTGERFGVGIEYVDEGDDLRGSGGALRLALDLGVLPEEFFILYGDSYLTVSLGEVERSWHASGLAAIMTVMRNQGRWDRSNATFHDGRVRYDKSARTGSGSAPGTPGVARDGSSVRTQGEMEWIDYGLSATSSEVIAGWLQPGQRGDLADLFQRLSTEGRVAGFEVTQRFYEIGSPAGLEELEEHLREHVHRVVAPEQTR